jgi:bacillaene synthase trans-acting acyltransferase
LTPVVWMFGGQGSQYYGMARDLYAAEPVFKAAIAACDDIAAPLIGASLVDLIYRDRPDRFAPFDRLLHSNPAICAAQYAVAEVLRARGGAPDYVLGYSLGTISAEIASGARALEDGLRIAIRLAELTEERIVSGGMLAVMAAPESFPGTFIAARNFPSHFVLAGETAPLAAAEAALSARKVAMQRLPVRYPFHCELLDPIQQDFVPFAESLPRRPSRVPVIAPLGVWDAVRQPVDFAAAVAGVEARGAHRYVDIGPSGTLATFVKYNLRPGSASQIFSTVTPFDRAIQNISRLEAGVAMRGPV